MKICISVGHSMLKNGNITSADGTEFGGGNEYRFCKEFAPALKKCLENAGHEVTIVRVPEKSIASVTEEKKYKIAKYNAKKYDLNLELHLNAASSAKACGTEALFVSKAGEKIAEAIIAKLSELYKNRGTKKRTDLYFLKQTSAPAVLLELFFCTNPSEWKKAQVNKRKMARLITEAINSVK
nr:N-acetylmuramoyl-L-alanine amidase [uncultured Lachnoclostridium sp.]